MIALPSWFYRRSIGFGLVILAQGALTAILAPFFDESQILNVVLIFLITVLAAASIWGYAVGLAAAVLADVLVNFFFIPPLHKFAVQEPSNVVALLIFLAVAVMGASMLALVRRQARLAAAREMEATVLRDLAREMAGAATPKDALTRLCDAANRSFRADACAVIHEEGIWQVRAWSGDPNGSLAPAREEAAVAGEALRRQGIITIGGPRSMVRVVTRRKDTTPLTFVPFPAEARPPGVLRLHGSLRVADLVDKNRLLAAFATEASLALHRVTLAEEAGRAEVLRQADELKSVLLSSISHDLRSPLTAIKTAVSNLLNTSIAWSGEDRLSFLAIIESQTDRLVAFVSDLLQMSRLESGSVSTELEPLQAHGLLDEVATLTSNTTAGRRIIVEAPPEIWLRADYGLMVQALSNLIENAARYSRPGGAIRLSAEYVGGKVMLSVADEGPGIPSEDLPHMFEKFYRGVQATKTKGSGLGLSIVKAMAEICGGSVGVRSNESGTIFAIHLPATEPVRVPAA